MLIQGFFREAIKENGQYIQVSEAVIEVLKYAYSTPLSMEKVLSTVYNIKKDLFPERDIWVTL